MFQTTNQMGISVAAMKTVINGDVIDHVMVPQKTVSFKCHPIYYARAYDKAKGTFP